MSFPRLKQFAQDGASDGDHVEWSASSGRWLPTPPALQLVDRVLALSNVTSMTLQGLNSNTDGVYWITGKILFISNAGFELQPNGIPQTNIRSWHNQAVDLTSTGFTLSSTNGWLLGVALSGDSINTGAFFFSGWIWPAYARGGAAGDGGGRFWSMKGTLDASSVGERRTESWGVWRDAGFSGPFTSLLVGGFGSTMAQGSEVMLYKAKF